MILFPGSFRGILASTHDLKHMPTTNELYIKQYVAEGAIQWNASINILGSIWRMYKSTKIYVTNGHSVELYHGGQTEQQKGHAHFVEELVQAWNIPLLLSIHFSLQRNGRGGGHLAAQFAWTDMQLAPKHFAQVISVSKTCFCGNLSQTLTRVQETMNGLVQTNLGNTLRGCGAGDAFEVVAEMAPAHLIALGNLLYVERLIQGAQDIGTHAL
jgi:hypothetical protein